MPTSAEIAAAVYGALRLARFDPQGFRYFDTSLAGFWKSFFAAVLIAPIHFLLVGVGSVSDVETDARAFLIQGLSYAVRWLIYPVVMLHVVDLLGRRERYLEYMVAYNWSNLPMAVLLALVAAVAWSGLLPPVFNHAPLLAFLGILVYQWYVARIGLAIAGPQAAALVLLDMVLSYGVAMLTDRLVLAA